MTGEQMERLAEHCTLETYPTRTAWLDGRLRGLGASDLPAVLGLSPYKGALTVWAEKTGHVAVDSVPSEAAYWGLALEPAVAQRYALVTQRVVEHLGDFVVLRSRRHPWLTTTLDRLAVGPDFVGALELKTASAYKLAEWEEEPPLEYQVQLQTQLIVTGLDVGSLACLVGGQKFVYADLRAHPTLHARLIEQGERFWRLVRADTPPPADGSLSSKEIIEALYPRPTPGLVVDLPAAAAEWDATMRLTDEIITEATSRRDQAKNLLRQAIGEAEAGVLPDGTVWTNKLTAYTRPAQAAKDISFRDLRRKATKGRRA